VIQWENVVTVWAEILPLTGQEQLLAQEHEQETTHKITMRHHDGITSDYRIRYGQRTFEIQSIVDVEEEHWELELMVTELEKAAHKRLALETGAGFLQLENGAYVLLES
jgi:SPP1 family predicted phage head-tail adaptor